jgi:hypothetical protein
MSARWAKFTGQRNEDLQVKGPGWNFRHPQGPWVKTRQRVIAGAVRLCEAPPSLELIAEPDGDGRPTEASRGVLRPMRLHASALPQRGRPYAAGVRPAAGRTTALYGQG